MGSERKAMRSWTISWDRRFLDEGDKAYVWEIGTQTFIHWRWIFARWRVDVHLFSLFTGR